MESRIVERAEFPYLEKILKRGDVLFLNTGEQVVIIRGMDNDNWRYLVGVLPPEDEADEYGEQMHADWMDDQALYSDLRKGW